MQKKVISLILLSILGFLDTIPVKAATFKDEITPIFCSIAKAIYSASFAGIAIAWIVVTALFLMALGNPERYNVAKKSVVVAVIGTAIILLGSTSIIIVENTLGVLRGGDIKSVCDFSEKGGEGGTCGGMVCGPNEKCYTSEQGLKLCVPK